MEEQSKVKLLEKESTLEFLPRLTEYLNGPQIYIKRDDEGGRSGGGNKLRKYERIIGEAISKKCDTLIIAGHYQSNAARELVGSACQLGLKSIVVCKEMIPQQNDDFLKNGNALLMNIMGAEIVPIDKDNDFAASMNIAAENVKSKGGKPYIIPFGGSNVLGSLGYVDCIDEIIKQSKKLNIDFPKYIFAPVGSGGTHSGLITGVLKYKLKTKIIGISVLHNRINAEAIVKKLTDETMEHLGIKGSFNQMVHVDDEFVGDGYGIY